MNIGIAVHHAAFAGGIERYAFDLAWDLRARGHRVELLAKAEGRADAFVAGFDDVRALDDTRGLDVVYAQKISILDAFDSEVQDHLHQRVDPVGPFVVTELREIDDEGVARWDEDHVRKQPDWSYDDEWSGKVPADLLVDQRAPDHQPG